MKTFSFLSFSAIAATLLASVDATTVYSPKVFVVSLFELERDPWLESSLNFTQNYTLPGLSPIYSTVHCTDDHDVCQVTLGEGEINAASSLTALTLNPMFNLTSTYWLQAGIAGGEPSFVTTGSVTFAKYAVQVALEYQIDYKDYVNTNPEWETGYFPYGTDSPYTYPGNVYGTEVFELNEKLRNRAVELASAADLNNGTETAISFRSNYAADTPGSALPSVVACDSLTSDNYFTGNTLNDYFSQLATVMTNGSAQYCATAQEDNASLEVLVRMASAGLVDYARVVIMRTISDFSRPPPNMANDTVGFFTEAKQGGTSGALKNLVIGGLPLIEDIISNWDSVYAEGETYKPENYIGDIFGTLGGTPDFGKDSFEIA